MNELFDLTNTRIPIDERLVGALALGAGDASDQDIIVYSVALYSILKGTPNLQRNASAKKLSRELARFMGRITDERSIAWQ